MKNAKLLLLLVLFGGLLMLAMPRAFAAGGDETVINMINCWSFDTADSNGSLFFDSGMSLNNATRNNININSSDCKLGQCINKTSATNNDATTVKISDKELTLNNTRTVIFWHKGYTTTSSGYLFGWGVAAETEKFAMQARGDNFRYSFDGGAGTSPPSLDFGVSIKNQTEWTHITLRWNSSDLTLFFNGTEVETSVALRIITANATQIKIGNSPASNNGYVGLMDEMKIYNGSLSNANISADYNSGAGKACVQAGADVTSPKINLSLNDTSLSQNDGVNVSANVSDDIGLSFCQFIHNMTGFFNITNISISGTSAQCSNATTINVASGSVINFTIRVNDTSNNLNQSSQIITIGDVTDPEIKNITLQHSFMNTTNTNILRIKCEDAASFLNIINFSIVFNLTTENLTRSRNVRTDATTGTQTIGSFGIQG